MGTPRPLPPELGRRFTVRQAADAGVNRGRLRRTDLEIPFRGVRAAGGMPDIGSLDPFDRQAAERRIRARRYAPRLRADQCVSHESAVALWGGPLPLVTVDGEAVDGLTLPVDVCTLGHGTLVRAAGVRAHRAAVSTPVIVTPGGLRVTAPAAVWAQLGTWTLSDLVALGDYLCRVWRPGPGRTDVGKRPLASIDDLHSAVASGRRTGSRRLREAVELVRTDSWSPRESKLRCHLVLAGLPEPALNHDVYDEAGRFIGCVDLAYPSKRVAIEYQSMLHHSRYAADVERIAALRAAGWTVIEVSSALFARPDVFVARVRAALGL